MDLTEESISPSQKNFLVDIWTGNRGLAFTYWVYGVLGGIVWAVVIFALNIGPDSGFLTFLLSLMTAYYCVVYVGIWQAATKYSGNKIWAVLAKFVVIVTALPIFIKISKWYISSL